MDYSEKSTVSEIRNRFDNDVDRFSNLETGQREVIDAALIMELMVEAATVMKPNAKTMLDIGCGAGNNTLKMLQRIQPLECDLVDLSMPMLTRAKERVSAVNKGSTRIFQEDFRVIELERERYDIIIAAAVLHHLRDDDDWRMVFQKMFDLTAPGGSVWISDFVSHEHTVVQEMMWERYGAYLRSFAGTTRQEELFRIIDHEDTPRSVAFQLELLRSVGFSKVDLLHKNSCCAAFGAMKA